MPSDQMILLSQDILSARLPQSGFPAPIRLPRRRPAPENPADPATALRSGKPGSACRPLLFLAPTACILKLLHLLGIGFCKRLAEDAVYVFPDFLGKLLVECAVGVPIARFPGPRQDAGEHPGRLDAAL
jgi:hypothetical protein